MSCQRGGSICWFSPANSSFVCSWRYFWAFPICFFVSWHIKTSQERVQGERVSLPGLCVPCWQDTAAWEVAPAMSSWRASALGSCSTVVSSTWGTAASPRIPIFRGFIEECFQWETSLWTSFPSILKDIFLASSKGWISIKCHCYSTIVTSLPSQVATSMSSSCTESQDWSSVGTYLLFACSIPIMGVAAMFTAAMPTEVSFLPISHSLLTPVLSYG